MAEVREDGEIQGCREGFPWQRGNRRERSDRRRALGHGSAFTREKARSSRSASPTWRGHGHCPALGDPGKRCRLLTDPEVSPLRDSMRPLGYHDCPAAGIALALPVSLPTASRIPAAATRTSKFGAENVKTEWSSAQPSPLSPANEAPSLGGAYRCFSIDRHSAFLR